MIGKKAFSRMEEPLTEDLFDVDERTDCAELLCRSAIFVVLLCGMAGGGVGAGGGGAMVTLLD